MSPEVPSLCRRLNPGGGPGTQNHTKSTVNAQVLEATAKVLRTAGQSRPHGGKGCRNDAPKLTFGSPGPPFSVKNRDSGPSREPYYLLCLGYI